MVNCQQKFSFLNTNKTKYIRFRYSFIRQGTSTRRQRMWPFRSSSQAATCYYQFNHSKVEAIPVSALPKDTTSELAGLSPY